jgi:hypothetical protein
MLPPGPGRLLPGATDSPLPVAPRAEDRRPSIEQIAEPVNMEPAAIAAALPQKGVEPWLPS